MLPSPLLRFASTLSLLIIPAITRAQSVTLPTTQSNPDRIVGGSDLGTSTRSSAFNPYGVSYSDCASDMTLRFTVVVTDFQADMQLAVWGGPQGIDCSLDTSRVGTPACWPLLAAPLTGLAAASSQAAPPIDVRVRDLVGYQGRPPANGTYAPLGAEACTAQTGFAKVPMAIWFIPTDPSGHVVAGSSVYDYTLTTDLVGPPPPHLQPLSVGDTMLVVNWTPNTDGDTYGYDVYRDPAPGYVDVAPPDAQVDCPPASDASAGDAACVHVVTGGGSADAGVCASAILSTPPLTTTTAGATGDGGQELDDAGNPVASGNGGISQIPDGYRMPGETSDVTVGGATTGSFQMLGLQNKTWYGVAVAAVDQSGNVGPLSTEQCDFPDVVNDFYTQYREDGGGVGCAFGSGRAIGGDAACVAAALASAIAWRRRRRDAPR
jgi:hypothetical protein